MFRHTSDPEFYKESQVGFFFYWLRYNCLKLVQAYNTTYHLSLVYLSVDTTN